MYIIKLKFYFGKTSYTFYYTKIIKLKYLKRKILYLVKNYLAKRKYPSFFEKTLLTNMLKDR
jgi:hypothetical protein